MGKSVVNCDIPGELFEGAGLASWIADVGDGGDARVSHVHLAGDSSSESDFSLLELEGSRVDDCSYRGCDFSRSYFSDVAFSNTDFSNCNFSGANFTRCTFSSCKFTGADFQESVLRLIDMRESTCLYASFAKAKLEDFSVFSSDFSHADIVEARLKNTSFDEVGLIGANFFHTDLCGVDLTSCRLENIVLSDAMGEVRGCMMDVYQAAGIAQRLGVIVKG